MESMRRWWFAPIIGVVFVGCQPKAATAPEPEPSNAPVTTEKPVEPVAKLEVPASYKHAGFEYYGLGNTKAPSYELKQGSLTRTGGLKLELEKVDGEGATYLQSWTGDLAANGSTRLRVNEKGIYSVEVQGKAISPPQLDMPANPKPGDSWKSDTKIEMDSGSLSSTVGKVIGVKTIKLSGKDIQVLVIERTSAAKLQNPAGKFLDQTLKSVEYYQKGVGPVKFEVTVSGKGVPTNSFTMEAKL